MMFHAPAYALFEAPDDSQYFKDTAALLSTLADASTSRTAVRYDRLHPSQRVA